MKISNIFNKINNWNDFNDALISLNNKEKGDAFELLSKLYFIIDHKYDNYDNIWLLSEVPKKELEIIGLESRDLGIDLIAKKGNEYHAIQCKYHTDKNQNVTFREVSTFISLLGGYDRLTEGYICSSAISTSKNYDDVKKKHISKLLGDTWSKLDKEFFDRVRKYLNKEKYNPIPFYPRPHQENATNEAYNHFIKNKESRGKLIFPCGAGKSLTGFWMMEKLDAMSTVIAVPSLSLIKQTLDVYLKEIVARGIKVNWLCICSDEGIGDNSEIRFKTDDIGVPCKTDPEYIKNWLLENKDTRNVIFTTYQSSRLIATISKELNHTFDLGILDEAHKTVGGRDKLFSHLLFEENISIRSRIFMTATERFYRGSKDDIVSMDDIDIYGDIFAQMSFKEAIDLELLTDYKIITIDIKKSEISEFIKDNGLVELNSVWKKETEARSLASMLALRKAMKQFPIKNAVSFHSSIEKAKRNKELHTHITANYGYDPIDTYTVSGKDKTSKRNDIIQEFASSKKALITNARCLTEGVDVPNIDCIVFADPRKSKVDIVQALGRALRKKEGKDWGYVILPVIYDGETNEIDNDNFNEILSIVRGLAANDERIIEYFKDKSLGKGKERSGGAEVFTMISETLSESDFAEQLNIRIWEKLSRFNWMPYEEAREFSRSLKLSGESAWRSYRKTKTLPIGIPVSPSVTYGVSFTGWGDFLGTGNLNTAQFYNQLWSYDESKKYLKERGISSQTKFNLLKKGPDFPMQIPRNPQLVYSKLSQWIDWGDFLSSGRIATRNREYREFNKAVEWARTLNLNSENEWREYKKNNKLPVDIPRTPQGTYGKKNQWLGFSHWLGYKSIAKPEITKSFNHYRKTARKLNLSSSREWHTLYKNGKLPNEINYSSPDKKFKEWISWSDFLGSGAVSGRKKHSMMISYKKLQKLAINSGLKTAREYYDYVKDNNPEGWPKHPERTYKHTKEWLGWGKLLNTARQSNKNKRTTFVSFDEAKEIVSSQNLKGWADWRVYTKSKNFPETIPKNPNESYKNDWIDMQDFLGYESLFQEWLPFKEAREFARKLNLKTGKGWREYCKTEDKPSDIPNYPIKVYKDNGWHGIGDWLGTNTLSTKDMKYLPFEEARAFVRSHGFKSEKEWLQFSKTNEMPNNIPAYAKQTYKEKGYLSMADWLGNNKPPNGDREFMSFTKAKEFVHNLNLKNNLEWRLYSKSGKRPYSIPGAPERKYKNKGWKGWSDFLGKEK